MAKKDNTLKILTHILGLFTSFIGPLIILLSSEDKNEKNHARTSLNWQISFVIYAILSFILIIFYLVVGLILFFTIYVLHFVFCIVATVKASKNILWKYPLAISFFRVK